eukprot:6722170-Pyramimonas_sp.AAC.1
MCGETLKRGQFGIGDCAISRQERGGLRNISPNETVAESSRLERLRGGGVPQAFRTKLRMRKKTSLEKETNTTTRRVHSAIERPRRAASS